ncbi:hypothetical protein PTTG_28976 [Puccinia triticina 1-1 BBBD Race 1]|uniref:Uncharacterized protein n=1 Tax=Puccinia triticina (isolate 1-1 / race 1 (BBBD)) TaxID=630390 RepID=A0A180G7D5_PUCT1|nr:hypothetical protein PTTG_28976 [Puccinia triticina 1-1 BBBD Race 1]
MSPSPAPDPPAPPTGFQPETPLQLAIQITNDVYRFLTEAVTNNNPTQTLTFEQVITVVSSTLQLQTTLAKICPVNNTNVQSTDQKIDNILEQLDCLDRQTLIPAQTVTPSLWATVTAKKQKKSPASKANLLKKTSPPLVPTNQEINEFKPASVVIQTPPGFNNLNSMSAKDITNNIKQILSSINAFVDSQPVNFAGIAILASKDLKLLTSSKAKAQWLLANKHWWTELFFSDLKTFPSRFPVLLHQIPTNFEPSNQAHLQELGIQNRINPSLIQSAQWLGNPTKNGKKNGSIVLHLFDKYIATKIERSGLLLQNKFYRGANSWPLRQTTLF